MTSSSTSFRTEPWNQYLGAGVVAQHASLLSVTTVILKNIRSNVPFGKTRRRLLFCIRMKFAQVVVRSYFDARRGRGNVLSCHARQFNLTTPTILTESIYKIRIVPTTQLPSRRIDGTCAFFSGALIVLFLVCGWLLYIPGLRNTSDKIGKNTTKRTADYTTTGGWLLLEFCF